MCAQRRLRSTCASAQSDPSLRCLQEETLRHLLSKNALSEDSDQSARMRRLIRIFAEHTCREIRFVTLWLVYFCSKISFCFTLLISSLLSSLQLKIITFCLDLRYIQICTVPLLDIN